MKKKGKRKVVGQEEHVKSGGDENNKERDDSTEITKKRIRIETNNYDGRTGKEQERIDEEQQEENVKSGSDENNKEQDDSTEITKKRIRIETNNYDGRTGKEQETKDEEQQEENVKSGGDENNKEQDDSTEITKKRIKIETNNYEGRTGKEQERKYEEQQEENIQLHLDEDNKEQDNHTEETRKSRNIRTPNSTDCEINYNLNTDPQPESILSQDKELILKCAWLQCEYKSTSMDSFYRHVRLQHFPHQETRYRGELQEVYYCCLWYLCNFETRKNNEFIVHISYHSYHTTLKCVGKNVLRHTQLPKCNRKRNTRNQIPKLPSEFKCCWEYCKFSCRNTNTFFYHVECHVRQQTSGEEISCGWNDCLKKVTTIIELEEHVRTHTKEKTLACPNCGTMIETSLKFIKHMIFPEPDKVRNYVCNRCQVVLPSLLEGWRHILNMHPHIFKCTHCKYKCQTRWGLEMHRQSHVSGKRFPDDDCSTVDPHTLHPIIAFDDGFEWATGTDSVVERHVVQEAPWILRHIAFVNSIPRLLRERFPPHNGNIL